MGIVNKEPLHLAIRDRSRTATDPAGREVEILDHDQAEKIAQDCGREVPDVYLEALELGILPHRYIRNREIISTLDQMVLAKSRVSVVGAGGLGGQVILLLARMGVGSLVVVDQDIFEESNLNRQALCDEAALGKPKAEVAVRAVAAINPGIRATACHVRAEPSNMKEILKRSRVVVDALDNVSDRLALERASKALGIPLVHGALAGFEGQVMTIFPEDPGLRQLYGEKGAEGDKSKTPESILGVPTPTPAFVATLQVMEVVKILLKRGSLFRNVMVHVDLESGQMNKFRF